MQFYAACSDPEIRVATQAGYRKLWEMVERVTGLPFQAVVDFFAVGMLMNVAAAMDLPSVDERWTSWCPKDGQGRPEDTPPSIRDHLHASLEGLQWTVNAYTCSAAAASPAAALLLPRLRKDAQVSPAVEPTKELDLVRSTF